MQSFVVMPWDGVGPGWSNLKRHVEILIAGWNLPLALPNMGQCGTAHIPHPLYWERDPNMKLSYLGIGPRAQTPKQNRKSPGSADTLLYFCSSSQLCEFGQVISPLFLHFLISKMGMRAWPFHLCTVMRISVFPWVKLPISLSSFMDQLQVHWLGRIA